MRPVLPTPLSAMPSTEALRIFFYVSWFGVYMAVGAAVVFAAPSLDDGVALLAFSLYIPFVWPCPMDIVNHVFGRIAIVVIGSHHKVCELVSYDTRLMTNDTQARAY